MSKPKERKGHSSNILMSSSWPDEKHALVDACALVASSTLALRSFVHFLLLRRRGVNVGRHAFGLKDLARSVAYSLTQTSARNQGLVVAFAAAVVGRRWLRRYVFDAVFGRRPGRRTVAKVLRALAILVSRNVWAWARDRVHVGREWGSREGVSARPRPRQSREGVARGGCARDRRVRS